MMKTARSDRESILTERICVALSKSEKQRLKDEAKKYGFKLSAYIRLTMLGILERR